MDEWVAVRNYGAVVIHDQVGTTTLGAHEAPVARCGRTIADPAKDPYEMIGATHCKYCMRKRG